MAEFEAYAPTVEVAGQAVLAILAGMDVNQPRAVRILAQNGIPNLDPTHWYSQQMVLNSFKTVFEKIGPATVRAIGRKIPEKAQFPPNIKTIEDGLASIDMAYHMNHRGAAQMGSYRFSTSGARSGKMLCDNPYPCEMDMGLIEAIAERFRPATSVRVKLEHAAGDCRHQGAGQCGYQISW